MSIWICRPRVTLVSTGETLFDLWVPKAESWDAYDVSFDERGRVTLGLRRYPAGDVSWTVVIDPAALTFELTAGRENKALNAWLSRRLRRV